MRYIKYVGDIRNVIQDVQMRKGELYQNPV